MFVHLQTNDRIFNKMGVNNNYICPNNDQTDAPWENDAGGGLET